MIISSSWRENSNWAGKEESSEFEHISSINQISPSTYLMNNVTSYFKKPEFVSTLISKFLVT